MIPMTLEDIAAITGGHLAPGTDPKAVVTGKVEFDSRKIGEGDLFVALHGATVDGHDFAAKAVASGAVAALLFRDVGVPGVIVPKAQASSERAYATAHDTTGAMASVIAAMSAIAHAVVKALAPALTVIGVTGSAGKTSTKDMLASLCRASGPTVAPPGSFNNEIGHPYTALQCTRETQFLVTELSARSIGNIAHLAAIAPPKVGIVLNVGSAHLGEFGSRAGIAQAKGELVEALDADGVAVLNADDELVAGMAERTKAKVLTFGRSEHVDVRAIDVELDELARPRMTVTVGEEQAHIRLQVAGEHQVANALASIAAGVALGFSLDAAAASLSEHTAASAHRMALIDRADGVTIIDDAYNANLESMRAGLNAAVVTARHRGSQAWAVLGPMGELGAQSLQSHRALGGQLAPAGIVGVVVVGSSEEAAAIAAGSGVYTLWARDAEHAAEVLAPHLRPHDVVLVKASNAAALWETAEALAAWPVDKRAGREVDDREAALPESEAEAHPLPSPGAGSTNDAWQPPQGASDSEERPR